MRGDVGARILVLSDTHLGRHYGSAGSADALRPLWQGFDRLIVNGDLAEVHHPRHWRAACRETLLLQRWCEDDGVELTLLSGNHDPFLSDIRHLHLAGGHVFVTHGDVMHPAIAPWSPAARRLRAAHDRATSAYGPRPLDLHERLTVSQHASHVEWLEMEQQAARSSVHAMLVRPWLLAQVLRYWQRFPTLAARFATEHAPEARIIVLGHTHRAAIDRRLGRIVINTGSFGLPGRPRAVVLDDEALRVHRIEGRRAGVYALASQPLARFPLPVPNIAAPPAASTRPGSERPSARAI